MVESAPVRRAAEFFVSGGTLPLDSASYIERSSDRALYEGLRAGRYCYVLNSRQMGKSSLSVRTMARLGRDGIRTAFIDLTQIGGRNVTADQWYAGMAGELGRSLGLRAEVLGYFRDHAAESGMQRFFGALREVILEAIATPLVVFLDEIDATRNLPFDTDEFFAGIRESFNRRVHDPVYERLTFCLLGVAVPSDLIRNRATTPFNIGERIQLQDFTVEELGKFGNALGTNGPALVRRVHYWTNGQPFLTQSLCQTIAVRGNIQSTEQVDALVAEMFFGPKSRDTNVNLADVSNRALNDVSAGGDPERFRADILSTYERAWRGGKVRDDESNRVAVILKLSGLMRAEGGRLRVRNRIYHHVFDRDWVRANMPGQELLRQQMSFRRGLLRATAAATVIVGTVAALGAFAWTSRQEALRSKAALDYKLYVADMNNLRLFEETGDTPRMAEVLERTRNSPHRGFEWGFWMGRLHDAAEAYTLDYKAQGKREEGLLSPDGQRICIVDTTLGAAAVVERSTKRVLAVRRLNGGTVAPTRAGFRIVHAAPGGIQVRDFLSGEPIFHVRPEGQQIGTSVHHPRGDLLTVVDPDAKGGSVLRILDLADGALRKRVRIPVELASPVLVSKDATVIVGLAFVPDYRVVAYHLEEGRVLDSFPAPARGTYFDLSVGGRYLVYRPDPGERDIVRDLVARKQALVVPQKIDETPLSVTVSNDERTVICLYPSGRAVFRDLRDGSPTLTLKNVWSLSLARQGTECAVATDTVRVIDLAAAESTRVALGNRATRDGLGHINVFAEAPRRIERRADPSLASLQVVGLTPQHINITYNGLWNIYKDVEANATYFDPVFKTSPRIRLPVDAVNMSCGASSERFLVVQATTDEVIALSGKTGQELWRMSPGKALRGIWVEPTGRRAFASLDDNEILTLDCATGAVLVRKIAHNLSLANISFSADGLRFLTCGQDGRAILWDMESLTPLREFRGNASQRMSGADVSRDGRRVATCSYTGAWQLWDAHTGEQLLDLRASRLPLRTVTFTRDGSKVVTAGDDGVVRAWTVMERDPTVRIPVAPSLMRQIRA